MILHTWEWCSPGCDICVVCGVQQTADNPVSPECSGKTHKPSDVVVSRTDLEAVLNDYFDGVFDEPGIAIAHRLRAAVWNTENQT